MIDRCRVQGLAHDNNTDCETHGRGEQKRRASTRCEEPVKLCLPTELRSGSDFDTGNPLCQFGLDRLRVRAR